MTPRSLNVAVIGAGMAGLEAARELRREGHRVTIYEQSCQLGGTWRYDPRTESDPLGLDPDRAVVHSSAYESLRVNLPRSLMGFLDYPFEGVGDGRWFPWHGEVLRFLEEFAAEFGLVELIRFGREVVGVGRMGGGGWFVESRGGGGDLEVEVETEVFEAVVVCNGKHTEPRIAEFEGREKWVGVQLHSHSYRTPEPFQNQIVVVIGAGSSALDISEEISSVAREVHLATRWPIPQFAGIEDPDRYHQMIKCAYEDGKVEFEDGSYVYADAIIHCTGYKFHYPFLKTDGIVSVEDNRVGPLYQHVFPPSAAPWLSFIGLPYRGIVSLIIELQSRWVAKVLSGEVELPSEEDMLSSVENHYAQMKRTSWPVRHSHNLKQQIHKFGYENWLAAQVGLSPIEKWREELYFYMFSLYPEGSKYRDELDVDEWMQERGYNEGEL
uniref:Flavin-containing monooxygenase n=1 Tax=Kalanchoe fedtschenkoi TaxID=63787 RepID=A0A7N0UY51_KALFE